MSEAERSFHRVILREVRKERIKALLHPDGEHLENALELAKEAQRFSRSRNERRGRIEYACDEEIR